MLQEMRRRNSLYRKIILKSLVTMNSSDLYSTCNLKIVFYYSCNYIYNLFPSILNKTYIKQKIKSQKDMEKMSYLKKQISELGSKTCFLMSVSHYSAHIIPNFPDKKFGFP